MSNDLERSIQIFDMDLLLCFQSIQAVANACSSILPFLPLTVPKTFRHLTCGIQSHHSNFFVVDCLQCSRQLFSLVRFEVSHFFCDVIGISCTDRREYFRVNLHIHQCRWNLRVNTAA
ncbi:MAG: hypothetical protein HC828_21255 [Blastochloris sp.]|nr:hypothetical protein [Blastochloris sp.]